MNNKFYCGIDVSKKKLDVMLLVQEKYHYKVVENSNDGVIFLQEWIKSKLEKDAFVHFCMEATNVYHELLAFSTLKIIFKIIFHFQHSIFHLFRLVSTL